MDDENPYSETVERLRELADKLRDTDAQAGEVHPEQVSAGPEGMTDALAALKDMEHASQATQSIGDAAIIACARLERSDGFEAVVRAVREAQADWLREVIFDRAVDQLYERQYDEG